MKEAELKIIPGNDEKSVTVIISGNLVIDNISSVRERISEETKDLNGFDVLIQDAESFDLSFYQFLISLKRTSEHLNKTVNINISVSDELNELFLKSGFDLQLN